jgi:hypothetical protein
MKISKQFAEALQTVLGEIYVYQTFNVTVTTEAIYFDAGWPVSIEHFKKQFKLSAKITESDVRISGYGWTKRWGIQPTEEELKKIVLFYQENLEKTDQYDNAWDLKEILYGKEFVKRERYLTSLLELNLKEVRIPSLSFFKGMNTTKINDGNDEGNKFINNFNL